MRGIVLLGLVLAVTGARPAMAQFTPSPMPWTAGAVTQDEARIAWARDLTDLTTLQLSRQESSWTRRGAFLGAVVGGVATYVLLHQGGSTSLCDRAANQDAMGRRECIAVTVGGSVAGAGLGAWIGSRFRRAR